MYTPSLVQIAVSGLLAASAVNSFELPGHRGLVTRGAGALVAFAIPALAAPVAIIDSREPHHKGVKGAGGKKNNKRHHKGVSYLCRSVYRAFANHISD